MCFCDTEQARDLQIAAINALKDKLEATWGWVETVRPYQYSSYAYDMSGVGERVEPETAGVVITVDEHTFEVKTYEGVQRRERAAPVRNEAARFEEKPVTEKVRVPKDAYTGKHLEEAHRVKTRALQNALVKDYRTCLILNVMGLLGVDSVKVSVNRERYANDKVGESAELKAVFDKHLELAALAGYGGSNYPLRASTRDAEQELAVYDYLQALDDASLSELFCALTSEAYGTWPHRDTGDRPLAVKVAEHVGVDMLEAFTLDDTFLRLYRKKELVTLAAEVGVPFNVEGLKTDALRSVILDHASRRRYVPGLVQFFPRGETPPAGLSEALELAKAA